VFFTRPLKQTKTLTVDGLCRKRRSLFAQDIFIIIIITWCF